MRNKKPPKTEKRMTAEVTGPITPIEPPALLESAKVETKDVTVTLWGVTDANINGLSAGLEKAGLVFEIRCNHIIKGRNR